MTDKEEKENKRMREKSGSIEDDSRLTSFLYVLARDFLPVGEIEIILNKCAHDKKCTFTNGWLAQWAQDAKNRLLKTVNA